MTALLSIRLSEQLHQDMKKKAQILHLSQTEYVRQAIEQMNIETEKHIREARLKEVSLRVRKESMAVNSEFSEIESDPDA